MEAHDLLGVQLLGHQTLVVLRSTSSFMVTQSLRTLPSLSTRYVRRRKPSAVITVLGPSPLLPERRRERVCVCFASE